MQAQLILLAEGVAFTVMAFAFLWVAKLISDARVRAVFDATREVDEGRNLAVALRRGGLYVGLAVGMLGALSGGGGGFVADLTELAIEGVSLLAFLLVAQQATDRIVIRGIETDQAVKDGNVAVGLVEAGVFIATGLIAFGSFAGPGGGVAAALVFFASGQVALIVLAVVYEKLTRFAVIEGIQQGNAAAGLMLGGMLVAFGFLLNASLYGPFTGWAQDLLAFALSAAGGVAVLLLLQWPIDRLFLPTTTLHSSIDERQNVAAVAVAVAVKIALALVVSAAAI